MFTPGRKRRVTQKSLGLAIALMALSAFFIHLPSEANTTHATHSLIGYLGIDKERKPIKVAHVVSLIVCEKEKRVKGFIDALAILRHSIHQNSVHVGKSNYSYEMVALIHESSSCTKHVDIVQRLGYKVLLRGTPVDISSIPNDWYRTHVENENCCGSAEFIKLFLYTLVEYPIVVHWDLDTALLQPMDDLFDSMLFSRSSPRGQDARARLQVQNPMYQTLPHRIDAFFTRDITSAKPWEVVRAVQGGFLVARPNLEHFALFQKFIGEGNYTPGRGPLSGWGGLGYGGFQGAMAYQVRLLHWAQLLDGRIFTPFSSQGSIGFLL